MEIHVLYDNRVDPDKIFYLTRMLHYHGLEATRIWEPVAAPTVVESINLSFKTIVRYAKEKKLKEICICEEDLQLTGDGAWKYFIDNKPKRFDIYIGGNYLINNPDSYIAPHYKLEEYVGNQLIIVHERYYDRFLSVPDKAHVDTIQKGLGDFYACWPMVALQRPGYSANAGTKVNYNANLKPEWVYNGAIHNL